MIKFLKSASVNGLAILLPVVRVFLALKEIFELLVCDAKRFGVKLGDKVCKQQASLREYWLLASA